jgi:hypothetical protein
MYSFPNFEAIKFYIPGINLSGRRHLRTNSFWKESKVEFQGSGKGSS